MLKDTVDLKMMTAGAGHHLPMWPDLQGQVCGERVHGHGDAAAGHSLVQARIQGSENV